MNGLLFAQLSQFRWCISHCVLVMSSIWDSYTVPVAWLHGLHHHQVVTNELEKGKWSSVFTSICRSSSEQALCFAISFSNNRARYMACKQQATEEEVLHVPGICHKRLRMPFLSTIVPPTAQILPKLWSEQLSAFANTQKYISHVHWRRLQLRQPTCWF